jgi:hypothetical protein
MDVLGWSAGPTVIQRIPPYPTHADLEAEGVAVEGQGGVGSSCGRKLA